MRIPCPCCGPRDVSEFDYGGDAGLPPTVAADLPPEEAHAQIYLRDNPRGPHRELWYHAAGCRRWLSVTRDTLTGAILGVSP